jgi:hypothetical protein
MKNSNNSTQKPLQVLFKNDSGSTAPKVATAKGKEGCFLPTIEVKDIMGCNNSFLKYCRENDLVFWGKIRNTYHYDLFSFRSATDVFKGRFRQYVGLDDKQ